MRTIGIALFALLGPALALGVTWYSSFAIIDVIETQPPPRNVVRELRTVPDNKVLDLVDEASIGASDLSSFSSDELIAAAGQALSGVLVTGGESHDIRVPEHGLRGAFEPRLSDLEFCSFIVPNVLIAAFDISEDARYLQEAVDYAIRWADFEKSLPVPVGYVFNDHATAARALVVTELWRRYRSSEIYESARAAELLSYVRTISKLLQDSRLYEYRTNHGIMQSLSLLHLAIAFPLLGAADENAMTGRERLLKQLDYFINHEGVVLEHSPAYHQNGIRRLNAAWVYFDLLNFPVPERYIERYRKAIAFRAALRRPDRTLPSIGDTEDYPYSDIELVRFNADNEVAGLYRESDGLPKPESVTLAPSSGWAILWDGLAEWPDGAQTSQTVFHWANFPTRAHKHADDLGLSIWRGGVQWVRGVGYWPYDQSRPSAVGWRSSNAPHWSGESADSERTASLIGTAFDAGIDFLAVRRENVDGSRIERQMVQLGRFWLVLDFFMSRGGQEPEVVWRFPPSVAVGRDRGTGFELKSGHASARFAIQSASTQAIMIDADLTGDAAWNSGVMVHGEKAPSPAIMAKAAAGELVIASLFEFPGGDRETDSPNVGLEVSSPDEWHVVLPRSTREDLRVERNPASLVIYGYGDNRRSIPITAVDAAEMAQRRAPAFEAYQEAREQYGTPYRLMPERRLKVTAALVVVGLCQLVLFLCIRTSRAVAILWPLQIVSLVVWLTLSWYLGAVFLV